MTEPCKVQSAECKLQSVRQAICLNSLCTLYSALCTLHFAGFLLTLILLTATTQAEDKPPTVRQVFVPVGNPKVWPKGERELVPFEEYLELREANQLVRPARRGASIEWQSLSATFDPSRGVLTDGRWEAEVRGSEKEPRL